MNPKLEEMRSDYLLMTGVDTSEFEALVEEAVLREAAEKIRSYPAPYSLAQRDLDADLIDPDKE